MGSASASQQATLIAQKARARVELPRDRHNFHTKKSWAKTCVAMACLATNITRLPADHRDGKGERVD